MFLQFFYNQFLEKQMLFLGEVCRCFQGHLYSITDLEQFCHNCKNEYCQHQLQHGAFFLKVEIHLKLVKVYGVYCIQYSNSLGGHSLHASSPSLLDFEDCQQISLLSHMLDFVVIQSSLSGRTHLFLALGVNFSAL